MSVEYHGTGFKTWLGTDGRFKATPCVKCKKGQGIINAPARKNKPMDYPDGWREIYNMHSWFKRQPKQLPPKPK